MIHYLAGSAITPSSRNCRQCRQIRNCFAYRRCEWWRFAFTRMNSQSLGARRLSPCRSCSMSAPVAFVISAATVRGRILHPGLSTSHCRVSGSIRSHNVSMSMTVYPPACQSLLNGGWPCRGEGRRAVPVPPKSRSRECGPCRWGRSRPFW